MGRTVRCLSNVVLFTVLTTIAVVCLGKCDRSQRASTVGMQLRSHMLWSYGPGEVTHSVSIFFGQSGFVFTRAVKLSGSSPDSGLRSAAENAHQGLLTGGQPTLTHLPSSIGLYLHTTCSLPPSKLLFPSFPVSPICIRGIVLLRFSLSIRLVLMPEGQCMHNGLHVCTRTYGGMDRPTALPIPLRPLIYLTRVSSLIFRQVPLGDAQEHFTRPLQGQTADNNWVQ